MTDERLEELIQREIDGANSSVDSRELAEHLTRHPQDRDRLQRLQQADRWLRGAPVLDPPPQLRSRIMRAVDNAERLDRKSRAAASPRWALRFRLRPAFLMIFACGLVAGFGLWALLAHVQPDSVPWQSRQVVGTTVVDSPAASEARAIAAPECVFDGGSVSAEVVFAEEAVRMVVAAVSSSELRIVIRNTAGFHLVQAAADRGGALRLVTRPQGPELLHRGSGRYELIFATGPAGLQARSPWVLTVMTGDTVLCERRFAAEGSH